MKTQKKSSLYLKSKKKEHPKYILPFIDEEIIFDSKKEFLECKLKTEKNPKLHFIDKESEDFFLSKNEKSFQNNNDNEFKRWHLYTKNITQLHIYFKSVDDNLSKYNFLNLYRVLNSSFDTSKKVHSILGLDISNDNHQKDVQIFYQKRLQNYIDAIQTFIVRKNHHQVNSYTINYLTYNDLKTYQINKIIPKIKTLRSSFDFIVISGTEEYFNLKKLGAYSEFVNSPIFLIQVYLILSCQQISGSAILYLTNLSQMISKELLFLLSHFYKKIKLIKHDETSFNHYIYLSDFKGIEESQLKELEDLLIEINNLYPTLGQNLNSHHRPTRKKYHLSKELNQKDNLHFVTSFLKKKVPQSFIQQINNFEKRTLSRMKNKELLLQQTYHSFQKKDHFFLEKLEEDYKREAKINLRHLGLVFDSHGNKIKELISKFEGGILLTTPRKKENYSYADNNMNFSYSIPYFKIESKSIENEIYRYLLLNDFKDKINHLFVKHNIEPIYASIFPKWIMSQVKRNGDLDPLIPSGKKLNNQQLLEDIVNVGNVSLEKAKIFLKEANLEFLCSQMIIKLFELQQNNNLSNVYVTTFEYQLNGTQYIKFHSSLTEKKTMHDFVFSLTKKRYYFLFNKYKQHHYLGNNAKPHHDFIKKCFILVLRYYTLESYNQQLAVSPTFYNYILKRYNAKFELFASSINTSLIHYCSLFPDIESEFGSRGRFDNINVIKGMYTAIPHFSIDILNIMVDNIIFWMDKAKEDIGIFITIPAWDKDEDKYGLYTPFDNLKKCKYLVSYQKIPKRRAIFFDYLLNRKITPCDIYVILVQNDLSRQKYNINLKNDIQKYWK